jgi:hypothetical protein
LKILLKGFFNQESLIGCSSEKGSRAERIHLRGDGTPKYARYGHYNGKKEGKPQFAYHQQSQEYVQRKLNDLPKGDKPNTKGHDGHSGHNDLVKGETLENSSSSKKQDMDG